MISLCQSEAVNEVFSVRGAVGSMLQFEAALARAEANTAVIPLQAAQGISSACGSALEHIDLDALLQDAQASGNLAIPFVKALTAYVRAKSPDAARYVHWGATSQDAIDTGTVLQLRTVFAVSDQWLRRCCSALLLLSEAHRETLMPGRTWLQHAVPVPFGLKTAGWLDTLRRHAARLSACSDAASTLQFGGAAGTLASLGHEGDAVAIALAKELGLTVPALPWHTHRDRFGEVATTLGLLMGTLTRIARDLALMMQTEVGELSEPAVPGGSGSSTMPHKRNPVATASILTAGVQVPGLVASMLFAMTQEHERALGGWQAEWQILPEICTLTCGALEKLAQLLEGLVVHPGRMRANLDLTGGLVLAEAVSMALAPGLGKEHAHQIVEAAVRHASTKPITFRAALASEILVTQNLSGSQIDALLAPENYLGSARRMVDRVLEQARSAEEDV